MNVVAIVRRRSCILIMGAYLGRPLLEYRRCRDVFKRVRNMFETNDLLINHDFSQKIVDFFEEKSRQYRENERISIIAEGSNEEAKDEEERRENDLLLKVLTKKNVKLCRQQLDIPRVVKNASIKFVYR